MPPTEEGARSLAKARLRALKRALRPLGVSMDVGDLQPNGKRLCRVRNPGGVSAVVRLDAHGSPAYTVHPPRARGYSGDDAGAVAAALS